MVHRYKLSEGSERLVEKIIKVYLNELSNRMMPFLLTLISGVSEILVKILRVFKEPGKRMLSYVCKSNRPRKAKTLLKQKNQVEALSRQVSRLSVKF